MTWIAVCCSQRYQLAFGEIRHAGPAKKLAAIPASTMLKLPPNGWGQLQQSKEIDMKVLNAMETEMVSGGGDLTCDNPNAASNIDGLGKKAAEEIWSFIDNVTMPIRDFGSDFGIWLYNMTHSC